MRSRVGCSNKLVAAAAIVATTILVGWMLLQWGEIPYVGRHGEWSIGIYVGNDPFHLVPPEGTENPVFSARDVTDIRGSFVADPFAVREGTSWYLFFEVHNLDTGHGDIGVATSSDGLRWTYGRIVLDEPFHLSFPHVFSWNDSYYMIPESTQSNTLRLYRAEEFPGRWSFVTVLLEGVYKDPVVFRHADRWWLFAETGANASDTLRLYYADTPQGPWTEHPESPIVSGNPNIARPAGRVLHLGQRLIRYAQDDAPTYGNAVRAFEITRLTTLEYEESAISPNPILEATGSGWNAHGMHHIDLHPLGDGRWLAVVDGYRVAWGVGAGY